MLRTGRLPGCVCECRAMRSFLDVCVVMDPLSDVINQGFYWLFVLSIKINTVLN